MDSKQTTLDKSKMNIVDCGTKNQRRATCFFIPAELIIMILLCLPADVLYNVMRYVCKKWYNIIQSPNFIYSHLRNSTNSLVIKQNRATGDKSYALQPVLDNIEVKELKSRKCIDNIRASCNGVVFAIGPRYCKTLAPCYVANLVTKQYLPLPLIPEIIRGNKFYLAYAAASGVYKVFYEASRSYILTIGFDRGWREVDFSQLDSSAREIFWFRVNDSLSASVRNFLYWVMRKKVSFIDCFDMESETFRKIPLPPQCVIKTHYYGILPIQSSICLYTFVEDYIFQFWLLKDQDSESGDGHWKRLQDINLTVQMCDISNLLKTSVEWISPCGWLRNGELLVLRAFEGVVVYNVYTGKFHIHEELNMVRCKYYSHVDSLVPINNSSLATTIGHPSNVRKSRAKVYSQNNMRAEFREP